MAKGAVDGIIEATKEVGGNLEAVAISAVGGAVEAAGSIGSAAVATVKDVLIGVVGGLKDVATRRFRRGLLEKPRRKKQREQGGSRGGGRACKSEEEKQVMSNALLILPLLGKIDPRQSPQPCLR